MVVIAEEDCAIHGMDRPVIVIIVAHHIRQKSTVKSPVVGTPMMPACHRSYLVTKKPTMVSFAVKSKEFNSTILCEFSGNDKDSK